MVKGWNDNPAKLEHLVEGEMGLAVLYGLHCLAYAALREIIEIDTMRYAPVFHEARAMAAELVVPDSIPAEARAEWRTAAIAAVTYFEEFMPPSLTEG